MKWPRREPRSQGVFRAIIAPLLILGTTLHLPAAPPVFTESFNDLTLGAWNQAGTGDAAVETPRQALRVTVPGSGAAGTRLVSRPVDLEAIRGCRVAVRGTLRAEGVAKPPKPWNGVKLMLKTASPTLGDQYESISQLWGDFDWKSLGFNAAVPADATEATLFLGLEDTTGTAWFDDIELTVLARPRVPPAVRPAPLPTEKLDRRTDQPRLRGVMYGPKGKEEDLRALAGWGANLIRWQFYWWDGMRPGGNARDLAAYRRFVEETAAEIERWLPLCRELGLYVLIDLHTPPGAGRVNQWPMFEEAVYQTAFIEAWDYLVPRFKDQSAVWGYDLLNEPSEGAVAPGLMAWRELAEHTARRVRAMDPHKAIVVPIGQHGGWSNLDYFPPLDVPGVVYTAHVYDPLLFTHQGVLDGHPTPVPYPGLIDGKTWNRDTLRALLQPLREYQLDYNVPIYIGEFSAPRWAPGDSAAAYLRDCLAIFEDNGWDWSYHAFREWHGWDAERPDGADENTPRSEVPSERLSVLREGFERNRAK